jgi:soluble lytic murein transglycosylase-like protein
MQLMPGTWREVRAQLGLGSNPYDPHDNILAGTFYLRQMHDRFGYPALFAAYNAGPSRYRDYLAGRRALPDETRAYLAALTSGDAIGNRRTQADLPRDSIFFNSPEGPARPGLGPAERSTALFAIRH